MDNVARWRADSAGHPMVLNLIDVGFTQIPDNYGITMKRADDNGLVCYVSRLGREAMIASVAARVCFKYMGHDDVYYDIVPSACDMTEELWTMMMNERSNSDILVTS